MGGTLHTPFFISTTWDELNYKKYNFKKTLHITSSKCHTLKDAERLTAVKIDSAYLGKYRQ